MLFPRAKVSRKARFFVNLRLSFWLKTRKLGLFLSRDFFYFFLPYKIKEDSFVFQFEPNNFLKKVRKKGLPALAVFA